MIKYREYSLFTIFFCFFSLIHIIIIINEIHTQILPGKNVISFTNIMDELTIICIVANNNK